MCIAGTLRRGPARAGLTHHKLWLGKPTINPPPTGWAGIPTDDWSRHWGGGPDDGTQSTRYQSARYWDGSEMPISWPLRSKASS